MSRQMAPINPIFPSTTDLRGLRQKVCPKKGAFSLTNLTETERWHYHAYDYGFRAARLENFERSYPLDPDGKWFDENLAGEAKEFYLRGMKP